MSEHRPKIHISEKEQAIIKMEKIVLCLKLEKENIILKKKPYMFHFILYTKYIPRRTVLKLSLMMKVRKEDVSEFISIEYSKN